MEHLAKAELEAAEMLRDLELPPDTVDRRLVVDRAMEMARDFGLTAPELRMLRDLLTTYASIDIYDRLSNCRIGDCLSCLVVL
jgi:hypothetical protein